MVDWEAITGANITDIASGTSFTSGTIVTSANLTRRTHFARAYLCNVIGVVTLTVTKWTS
jgi:hypothetical protein